MTTQRERAEAARPDQPSTIDLVEELASTDKLIHLHYPDPAGLKGDQLNFVAAYCATTLLGDIDANNAFLICYDADSRPPVDSLAHVEHAIAAHPHADVFHHSSRFELRDQGGLGRATPWRWLGRAVCDSGALRANRFVAGFEIPRLRNRSAAGVGPNGRPAPTYTPTSPDTGCASDSRQCSTCPSPAAPLWRTCSTASTSAPATDP